MKKLFLLVNFLFLGFFSWSKEIKLLSWNIQTFFDSETIGTEYDEFIKSKNWNETAYKKRLKKLCDSLKILDADICVLIEIENKEILFDISNFLQDLSWKKNKIYRFSSFAKNKDSSIGCGILSRFKIESISVHNVDAKINGKQPSMRPILKCVINGEEFELNLYVNHWKSMSGGKEESEIWRNWQEGILASLISADIESGKNNIIACGDFNRDISDFSEGKTSSSKNFNHYYSKNMLFDYSVELNSCWITKSGKLLEPGSYYFKENWSRIDHIFYSKNIEILDFTATQNELWCTEEGIPEKYKIYSGTGFSDHLPLLCKLKLQ